MFAGIAGALFAINYEIVTEETVNAVTSGIVLLHFPGHIMLYLGRDEHGTPMVIHAFSEYLEACEPEGETLRRVDRVAVSDLTLGAGTSRRSFLERITKVIVLGSGPTAGLQGAVERRPAAPPERPVADRFGVGA